MKYGDRVKWIYTHTMGNSEFEITKRGTYAGKIRHRRKHKGPQLAKVFFDNNKRVSKVPYGELHKDKIDEKKTLG